MQGTAPLAGKEPDTSSSTPQSQHRPAPALLSTPLPSSCVSASPTVPLCTGRQQIWASLAPPWVSPHPSSPVPGLKSPDLVVPLHLPSPLTTGDVLGQRAQPPVLEIYSRARTCYTWKYKAVLTRGKAAWHWAS